MVKSFQRVCAAIALRVYGWVYELIWQKIDKEKEKTWVQYTVDRMYDLLIQYISANTKGRGENISKYFVFCERDAFLQLTYISKL